MIGKCSIYYLLEEYKILGLPNNIKFVKTILDHQKFKDWNFDTNFISKYKDELINIPEEVITEDVLATILCKILNDQISSGINYFIYFL